MNTTTRKPDLSESIEKTLQLVCVILIAAAPVCAILSMVQVATIPLT